MTSLTLLFALLVVPRISLTKDVKSTRLSKAEADAVNNNCNRGRARGLVMYFDANTDPEYQQLMKDMRITPDLRIIPEKRKAVKKKINYADAPWAVHLHSEDAGSGENCGGTLISPRHVLTAAHCFFGEVCNHGMMNEKSNGWMDSWTVYHSGECLPFSTDECEKGKTLAVPSRIKRVIVPQVFFEKECSMADIAIVELGEDITSSFQARPACLISNSRKIPRKLETDSWGSDPQHGKVVTELTKYELDTKDCKEGEKQEDAICVDEIVGSAILCKGDSGSGGVFRDEWYLPRCAGVVSYGSNCHSVMAAVETAFMLDDNSGLEELQGGELTDVQQYTRFICKYTGVCPDGDNMHHVRNDHSDAVIHQSNSTHKHC